MLSEGCKTVVHLFHAVPLAGVSSSDGGGLLGRRSVRHELNLPLATEVGVVRHQDGRPLRCRRQRTLSLDDGLGGLREAGGDDHAVRLGWRVLDDVVHLVLLAECHRVQCLDDCHMLNIAAHELLLLLR